ncbi:MAG: nitrilase-related carbon-nitrogen hydrolase [Actinomycetes bacterium]
MKIASVEAGIYASPEGLIQQAFEICFAAAERKIDYLVFPELSLHGVAQSAAEAEALADQLAEDSWEQLSDLVNELELTVVLGHYARNARGKIVNRASTLAPGGARWHYDKIHLFDALGSQESLIVQAGSPDGDKLDPHFLGTLPVSNATCFDIRFPELFIDLASRGAQIVSIGAAWFDGPNKAEQLEVLVRARALDAGLVLALACAKGAPFTGRSGIWGPDGALLSSFEDYSFGGLATAEIKDEFVDAIRNSLPLATLRRLDSP